MFSREFVRFFFFFFQAEDGIRDVAVTGVQTCALPISGARSAARPAAWVRDFRAPRSPKGVRSVPGGSPGAQCGRGRHTRAGSLLPDSARSGGAARARSLLSPRVLRAEGSTRLGGPMGEVGTFWTGRTMIDRDRPPVSQPGGSMRFLTIADRKSVV